MKSRIKKILISAAALLFLTSGVSLANDWDRRHHKRHGQANYKVKKHHQGRSHQNYKPWKHSQKHYRAHNERHFRKHRLEKYLCEDGFYHWYDKHDRLWKSNRRTHRNHYRYSDDYKRHHRRKDKREAVVYKVALKDPDIVFKIVARDRW